MYKKYYFITADGHLKSSLCSRTFGFSCCRHQTKSHYLYRSFWCVKSREVCSESTIYLSGAWTHHLLSYLLAALWLLHLHVSLLCVAHGLNPAQTHQCLADLPHSPTLTSASRCQATVASAASSGGGAPAATLARRQRRRSAVIASGSVITTVQGSSNSVRVRRRDSGPARRAAPLEENN